jgi:hypothetical protein
VHGEPFIEASALLAQARIDVMTCHTAEARIKVGLALEIADRLPSVPAQILCVLGYGGIVAAEGQVALGAGVMRWAIAQNVLGRADRDLAERWLGRLGTVEAPEIAPTIPLREVLALAMPRG